MTEALAPVDNLLARRTEANARFFEGEAAHTARLCHRMAERFARGGRLVAMGVSAQARSDARHVAVEFVHPVIVGKHALPAIGLTAEVGDLLAQAELTCEPDDIAIAFDRGAAGAIAVARDRGCLTIAYEPLDAEWEFLDIDDDPFVRQEVAETHYHVLWELCHVFLEHRGLLDRRAARSVHDIGASSFLYPFLSDSEEDLEQVVADVEESIRMKAEEVGALREQTLSEGRDILFAAASAVRRVQRAGGTVLVLGNGGSATDAMDLVADLAKPPQGWPPVRALDLTQDTAIITAVANDIGVEEIFQRQVIAYGREGDALVALSTSGNSLNVIAALAEARDRGLVSIAFVGYDGGRVAAEGLADHVIVTRSEHIPRIQEAQASAYHVMRELLERA